MATCRTPALVVVCILAGCSHTKSFRVLDSASGQPLAGVRAEQWRPLVFLGFYQFSMPREFCTDETGSVEFDPSGERVMLGVYEGCERYLFAEEGYQSVEVRPKWTRLKATYESGVSRYLEQRNGVAFLPMLPIAPSK